MDPMLGIVLAWDWTPPFEIPFVFVLAWAAGFGALALSCGAVCVCGEAVREEAVREGALADCVDCDCCCC